MDSTLDTLIISALTEPVLVLDQHTTIIRCNPAAVQLLGYSEQTLLGLSLADVLAEPKQHLQALLQLWDDSIDSPSEELLLRRQTGLTFPLSIYGRAIAVDSQRYYVLELRDLSPVLRARQAIMTARGQAEAAGQAKAEFLALVSHEIRNPLNTIIGALNLLLSSRLDENQTSLLDTAHTAGESLRTIINEILDYARLEAGELDPLMSDFDLIALVESVSELLAPQVLAEDLDIATVIHPNVPLWVHGDSGRIRQILLQLADNAIKFTRQGGVTIKVSCPQPQRLRFEVHDTGSGIPIHEQQRIFQAFTQSASAYSRNYGGIGLGLAASKRLVELLDGDMGLESTPGQGSLFWFELPCQAAQECTLQRYDKLKDRQVLLIEANPLSAKAHAEQLRLWQMRTCVATDHQTALKYLQDKSQNFAVIVIDQSLNDSEGHPLTQALLDMVDIEQTPIILLLSASSQSALQNLRAEGIQAFLTKPVRQASLYRWLCVALGLEHRDIAETGLLEELSSQTQEPINHYRLLLVEDSYVNQAVTVAMLKRTGYRVDAVNNGLEALQAVRSLPYDLVLMDLSMPEMDGFETTARIRKLPPPLCDLPIIAVSANVVPEDRERLHKLGINDYVVKPIDRQRLLAAIRYWLKPEPVELLQMDLPVLDTATLERLAQETNATVMRRIISLFIKETHKRLEQINKAYDSEDWSGLQREAHNLKSAAGTFGAFRLQALAKDLDFACRNQQNERCRQLALLIPGQAEQALSELKTYLASTALEEATTEQF